MTQAERELSEERRKHIAAQSRAANPPRPARIIAPADRDEEMLGRMGFAIRKDDPEINWALLTRA